MDPQETKDERRAIYFGPLFPRRSAVARLRACERVLRLKTGARGWSGVQRGGRELVDDELPISRDGCREPHAIKAKRYETLRGSSSTAEPYIAFLQSRGSIVPFAEDNELASFNTMSRPRWLGGKGPIFRQENSDSNFMQMAAAAAAVGVRQHHHAGGGGSGTKGGCTARWCMKGCVTKVGRGWPPEPATRNYAPRMGRPRGSTPIYASHDKETRQRGEMMGLAGSNW
ncbi:hypothetical protein G5I_00335 [Acromyrmex echinatior]|uniref:Uncharacterized protein n=1 Tax=Acromyrmex echinatior TaxID=103372 RepID=F4W4L4_ACREC|nr:hypothetical protein G5I_00335 [Acromyrmex echinatior]